MSKIPLRLRIYVDTSVIGGCCDAHFASQSRSLIDMAIAGKVTLIISQVVFEELADAPTEVQDILKSIPTSSIEYVEISSEVVALRDAYLRAGIVGPRWMDDATHVAAATVIGADAIVSWNFKHIVRVDRIGRYNAVNIAHGYRPLTIVTPLEVIRENETENEKED
jgi:predicted nucleic acid-binding protein